MSVNVEVKNFDVNTGLEASVIIDGDIFTINIDPESVQKVLYSDPVALDLTDVSDSVRSDSIHSDNKSVDSERQGELTEENLAQLSQGSNVNNGFNVVSEDSTSSKSSIKNPMIMNNPQPKSDLTQGAAGAGPEPNDSVSNSDSSEFKALSPGFISSESEKSNSDNSDNSSKNIIDKTKVKTKDKTNVKTKVNEKVNENVKIED